MITRVTDDNENSIALYTETLYDFVYNFYADDYTKLFPEYNLYEQAHKSELEKKVYNHFYFYEIGFETEERFAKEFKTLWEEIIPMANNYFKAMATPELISFVNDTRKREYTLDRDTTSKAGKLNGTNSNKIQFKDTPYSSYPTDTKYNTTVTDNSGTTTSEQTTPSTGTQDDTFKESVTGLNGLTPAEAIKKYMDIVTDVDLWIIKQMRQVFMEVY